MPATDTPRGEVLQSKETSRIALLVGRVALLMCAALFLCVAAAPVTARAAGGTEVKQGSLTFEVFNDYAVLIGYDGSEANVVIPASVNGRKVTELGMRSYWSPFSSYFNSNKSLRSVSIPGTVASIPAGYFYNCSNLETVTIGSGVKAILGWAGDNSTFSECSSLRSVSLPNTLTTIGEMVFYNCTSLTSISLPASLTSLGNSTFYRCTSLQSLSIPKSVSEIPGHLCKGCSSLKSINIPQGVTSIGYEAFEDCGSLTSVTIPSSVGYLGQFAFSGCGNLKTVEFLPQSCELNYRYHFQNLAAGSTIFVQNNNMYDKLNSWEYISTARTRVVNRHPSRAMYRLYNPNSGEHFYTANEGERDHLKQVGWRYEGVGWNAPVSGTEVYRLYNANAGDHHYTTSKNERDTLVRKGWKYEGVGWYSGGSRPLYRQYNPNAKAGSHNYTMSKNENDTLVSRGWRAEGIGWYGL